MSASDLPGKPHPLEWSHGRGEVWPLGAALHHLQLNLDSRVIRPLAEAPWHEDSGITADRSIPAHLRHLGGEWPCVPFGKSAADPIVHGYGTDNLWRLLRAEASSSTWEVIYPADRPVERLRREVSGIHGHPAVNLDLTVTARRDCQLAIGLHPILRLPDAGKELRVEGAYSHVLTFPAVFEPGVSRLAAGLRVTDISSLPLADGGTSSLSELCQAGTEEAFQLFGVDGTLRLVYPLAGYAVRLEWDPVAFPTCLFWLSGGGRKQRPWNGQFKGLGVEPLDARFVARDGVGAIDGGRSFRAGEIWSTRYRISVERA